MTQNTTLDQLKQNLTQYELSLDRLATNPERSSQEEVLSLLRTRDNIQTQMQQESQASETDVLTLIALDKTLEETCLLYTSPSPRDPE